MAYESNVKREPNLMERIARLESDLEKERDLRKAGQEQTAESIHRLEAAVGFQPLEFPKLIDR